VLPILILFNFVVIYKHRQNIVRILNGTESKFRFKKNEPEEEKEAEKEERNDPEIRL